MKLKTVQDYKQGLLEGKRTALAQAITLIESKAPKHKVIAQQLIKEIYPHTGHSVRIGFTGVPGAGKSTLIDKFGSYLCKNGHSVAVLAVDPSSTLSGGSILGDKTRMELLIKQENAFVRPSPSQGTLGGVHLKTREAIFLCEAAGYNIIFVETMGVGQGEMIVKEMVDFFVLLALTGAGDDLQGIKKGLLEWVNLICVNKADGDNRLKAEVTAKEYESIIGFLHGHSGGWNPQVITTSAYEESSFQDLWKIICDYKEWMNKNDLFYTVRQKQMKAWLQASVNEYLQESFYEHPLVKQKLGDVEKQMMTGDATMAEALEHLIKIYQQAMKEM